MPRPATIDNLAALEELTVSPKDNQDKPHETKVLSLKLVFVGALILLVASATTVGVIVAKKGGRSNSSTTTTESDKVIAETPTTTQSPSANSPQTIEPSFSPVAAIMEELTPTTEPVSGAPTENLAVKTNSPTWAPSTTDIPTAYPTTAAPSFLQLDSQVDTHSPTDTTVQPTAMPSAPSSSPTGLPTMYPSFSPSARPTAQPSFSPSARPTAQPTTATPTTQPTTHFDCYSQHTIGNLYDTLCGLYCNMPTTRTLEDASQEETILFTDLKLKTTNTKCWNVQLEDIQTNFALDSNQRMVFQGDINGLDWQCSADYDWAYGFFNGVGTSDFRLRTSASSQWASVSQDFAVQAPTDVTTVSCSADVTVTEIATSHSVVEQVVGALNGLLQENIKSQVSDLMCHEMETHGSDALLASQQSCY